MPDTHDPITSPPQAVLRDLESRRRVEPDGSVWFADDGGRPILDHDRPGLPNADARVVAAWSHQHRPDIWGSDKPTPKTAPRSVSEIMMAVRNGGMSLEDAHAAVPSFLNPRVK